MLKPAVRTRVVERCILADFWDCLRLDPNPIKDLRARVERHVADGGLPILIADLTGVSFAGSTALGGFVAIKKQGIRIIFHGVEPTVREVFRVSNLVSFFSFADDEAAAFALASATPALRATTPVGANTESSASSLPTRARASAPPPLRRRSTESS